MMQSASTTTRLPAGWIVWKLKKADPKVASVRYRCLLPIFASAALQRRSVIVDGDQACQLDGVAALIFVKTFFAADVALAEAAAGRGIPIYFDLCDNIFAAGYGGKGGPVLRERFMAIAALATAIVSNGKGLSEVLREQLPAAWHHKLQEQPDMIETQALVAQAVAPRRWPNPAIAAALTGETLLDRLWQHSRRVAGSLGRLTWALPSRWLKTTDALPTVLWFGNSSSGGGNQGLAALAHCLPALRRAYQQQPFRLLVVSNDPPLYRQLIAGQGLPSRFEPWSALGVFDALARSRVCLVPAIDNVFNRGKSANRLVMALAHGVPVIASAVEVYQPFSDCVVLDDFDGGLVRYLRDDERRAQDLHIFQQRHWPHYRPKTLASLWVGRLGLSD